MTAQEIDRIECAIRHIESSLDVDPWACDIAVEAMKTQLSAEGTTSDLISRQDAIDVLSVFTQADALGHTPKQIVEALPSARQEIDERKEESAQNVPKEDLISRNAAIDAECEVCQIAPKKERGHNCTYYVHGCKEIECLRALPPAQPERKKGKWGFTDGFGNMCECSECGARIDIQEKFRSFFCYHCGADMREDVLQSAQPVLTYKGCKYDYYEYAGCRNCLRKERELYEPE